MKNWVQEERERRGEEVDNKTKLWTALNALARR